MAQDDYFYEIQLTNKQLVFYFMAGAAGLILSFLAGVMVGRGIDTSAAAGLVETRQVGEEKVVSEPSPTSTTEYRYPQLLESERASEGLQASASKAAAATPTAQPTATPIPRPAATASASRRTATPSPLPSAIGASASVKGFTVQVGAFKDRASANTVARSLRSRRFPAFVAAPAGRDGGFFAVRVGVYRDRADAEVVQSRLRDDKFQPIVIKQ